MPDRFVRMTIRMASTKMCPQVRWISLSIVLVLTTAFTSDVYADETATRPLTVGASLEMRRLLNPLAPIEYSPDGRKYAIRVARDDIERNGTWVDVLVGQLDSVQQAAVIDTVATLFTTSERDDDTARTSPVHPARMKLAWRNDSKQIGLLWNNGKEPTQVVAVDLDTRAVFKLTNHPTSIRDFTATIGNDRIVYIAAPEVSSRRKQLHAAANRGGLVASGSLIPLLEGHLDGEWPYLQAELYVSSAGQQAPRKLVCERSIRCEWAIAAPESISPNGRYAVALSLPAAQLPLEWDKYAHEDLRSELRAARLEPDSYDIGLRIQRTALIDLERGEVRPLWNAPGYFLGGMPKVIWSMDGNSILIGPTFVPIENADEAGMAGLAVAEVDVRTGRTSLIPVPKELRGKMHPVAWNKDGVIELGDGEASLRYTKGRNGWVPLRDAGRRVAAPVSRSPVVVELRQDLNTPPTLYAVDSISGVEHKILEVEPRLKDYTLGRVNAVEWSDSEGRPWRGRLYYPVGYVSEQRYPLVVQLDAPNFRRDSDREFSLVGAGDVRTAGYAAQALANRGIAVLSLSRHHYREMKETTQEAKVYMDGVDSAVAHFTEQGLVDSNRVGLIGYSRTGWYAQYIISHSKMHFAAAIAVDNLDLGYVEIVLLGMEESSFRPIGAPPFGEGLLRWFEESPGFNTHRVRTPLRVELDSGGLNSLLGGWETFSLLRYQKKPVELVLVPQFAHGDHPVQIPAQKLFSQEGTVDWFDFWLSGREDPDPRKAEQYQRWRRLYAQQERVVAERRAAGEAVADLPPLRANSLK